MTKERFEDFICTCNDEGKAEAVALMDEVKRRLEYETGHLLTSVVFSLEWDYRAHITMIACDQWAGVRAENETFETYIQCDWVEHGIAATWKAFADKFPKP